MKKNNWDKIELYIVSLWLLFVLIIVVTIDIPLEFGPASEFIGFKRLFMMNIIPCISLVFVLFGVTFIRRFNYKLAGSKRTSMKVKEVENKDYEHLTFLTTYIIPLICFNLDETKYVIVLFILLVIIGMIYIRTDLFYANPTLALMGFRVYKLLVEIEKVDYNIIVITRDIIIKSDELYYKKLDDKVYFVRSRR